MKKNIKHVPKKAAPFLMLYSERKTLANMGVRFSIDDVDPFEVEAFSIIDHEFNKVDKK